MAGSGACFFFGGGAKKEWIGLDGDADEAFVGWDDLEGSAFLGEDADDSAVGLYELRLAWVGLRHGAMSTHTLPSTVLA